MDSDQEYEYSTINLDLSDDEIDLLNKDESFSELTHNQKVFHVQFNKYLSMSKDYPLEEFLGDRVFNLEIARRLCLTNNSMIAKGAYSVYTSNSIMSGAMASLKLRPKGDMLSSDLEVACNFAYHSSNQSFINHAAQYVIDHAVKHTGYNEEWYQKEGKKISNYESSRHSKNTNQSSFDFDSSLDPVSLLNKYLDTYFLVHPNIDYSAYNNLWLAKTTIFSIDFDAKSNSKSNAKKSLCSKILEHLKTKKEHPPKPIKHIDNFML